MRRRRSIKIIICVAVFSALINASSAMAARDKSKKTDDNLPLPPQKLMKLLESGEFEIVSDEAVDYSTMNSLKLTLSFKGEPKKIAVKWKTAPKSSGEGWNNSPRLEMLAYKIQELFLDPEDYVVPPTTTRCIALAKYRRIDPDVKPNIKPFQCVYGAFAAWLSNVVMPKRVYDKQRFAADKRYAYHLANMNLLSYLINHHDGVIYNYLYSTNPANTKVFSVDNGLCMKQGLSNIFVQHWNKIRVPALPKKTIDRLRKVTRQDLDRLGVLTQMDPDSNGVLQNVKPRSNLNSKKGSRVYPNTVQIGLSESEIKMVKDRLEKLLKQVDQGKWELF